MARIEGVPEGRGGLIVRLAYFFSRRRLGRVPEPAAVMAHHPRILAGAGAFDVALEGAHRVEGRLKNLAGIKAATLVGCPF